MCLFKCITGLVSENALAVNVLRNVFGNGFVHMYIHYYNRLILRPLKFEQNLSNILGIKAWKIGAHSLKNQGYNKDKYLQIFTRVAYQGLF